MAGPDMLTTTATTDQHVTVESENSDPRAEAPDDGKTATVCDEKKDTGELFVSIQGQSSAVSELDISSRLLFQLDT